MLSTLFVLLAVDTGVVVIVVALAVVLVVLFVTLSMRGRVDEAAERADRQRDRHSRRRHRGRVGRPEVAELIERRLTALGRLRFGRRAAATARAGLTPPPA
jgi:hypothetical protein